MKKISIVVALLVVGIALQATQVNAQQSYADSDKWLHEKYVCGIKYNPDISVLNVTHHVERGNRYFPGGQYYNLKNDKEYVFKGGDRSQSGGVERTIYYDICKLNVGPDEWSKIKDYERSVAEGYSGEAPIIDSYTRKDLTVADDR